MSNEKTYIFDIKYKAGAHTEFTGKISDTIWRSITRGMYSTQFFMGNPFSCIRKPIAEDDICLSQKIQKRFPINVFSHFPYISNLAGSTSVLAWNGSSAQDTKTLSVIKSLEYELSVLSKLNGGVVIHPGSFPERNKGLTAISKSINKINFNKNYKLLLENSAGQGTTLATTLKEIQTILNQVNSDKKEFIGVCIDTCHLYSYGEYDISKIHEIDRFFKDFDEIIGLDKFWLLHLNDSKNSICCKKDRHELIGKGFIWSKCNESLTYLLDKCETLGIPIILETDVSDILTLAMLK